jgi:DNA-binding NtrC family response regulator
MTRERSEAAMRALRGRRGRPDDMPTAWPVSSFEELLGSSAAMEASKAAARDVIRRVGDLDAPPPILIVGEGGTGRQSLAKIIHCAGARRRGPSIDYVVGALSDEMFEWQLFGFESGHRGARRTPGLVHEAHGGTLVLREFDRLPARLARRLLDVVTHRNVRRTKSMTVEPADFGLIATSRTDTRVFRPFGSIVLTTPPLRDRGDDVLLLARYYLAGFASGYGLPPKTLSPRAEAALLAYDWRPYNLWGLTNRMERATLLIEPQELEPEDLSLASPSP